MFLYDNLLHTHYGRNGYLKKDREAKKRVDENFLKYDQRKNFATREPGRGS